MFFLVNSGFLAGQCAFKSHSVDNRRRTVLALMGVGSAASIDDDEAIGLMVTALLMARSVAAVVARGRPDLRRESKPPVSRQRFIVSDTNCCETPSCLATSICF